MSRGGSVAERRPTGRGVSAAERRRLKTARRTLMALALLMFALWAWQQAAMPVRSLTAVGAASGEQPHRQAVLRVLFPTEGFEITGYSEDPLVVGFACEQDAALVRMQVDRGMRRAGWAPLEAGVQGIASYSREPTRLWKGCEVCEAVVALNDVGEGQTSVLVELL